MSLTNKLCVTVLSVPLFVGGTALPQLSSAEERAIIEEVVVTARKRAENLQEVPIAVTAFTEKTIERAGIERPQDFIALTPNVTMVDTANAGDTQVTIRGIVSTRDAESTFAYVVDGVLITNPNGFNEELFDVQQIEVLKGPQGALYGRNAVAGAILVTTKKPNNDFESQIKLGVGTDELRKISAVMSGPIVKDKFFARLAVSNRETDGQHENEFTGEDDVVDFFEDQSVRGRLLWEVSDALSIDAQFSRSEVEAGAINFNATFQLPGTAAFFGNPDFNIDVNDHDFTYLFNVPGENEQENSFFSLKTDFAMDTADLTVIYAYDNLEEYLLSDGTSAAFGPYSNGSSASQAQCSSSYNDPAIAGILNNSPFYAVQDGNPPADRYVEAYGGLSALLPAYSPTSCDGYQYQERNQESASLEIKLSSNDAGAALRWVGGVYIAEIEREVAVSYGADLGLGFARQPYVAADGANPTDLLFSDDFDTSVVSAFGQIELDISDSQELALALRWDHEEREVSNNVPALFAPEAYGAFASFGIGFPRTINPAFQASADNTSIINPDIADRESTYVQVQPKISWNWQVRENYSLYASYGIGFRSGGFNNIGSAATVNGSYGSFDTAPQNMRDNYDKEVSKSFELGLKSQWLDRRVRVNAALFNTDVEDNQFFNFFAGSFGLLRVVTNIDEVNLRGLEIDFEAILSQGLSLHGGLGLIDSEIKDNANRPYTEGNEVPLAPESTANLGLQFIQPLGAMELLVRLDWQYVGETWFHTVQDDTTTNAFTDISGLFPGSPDGFGFGTSNYDNAQRDAYDTLNLRVSLESESWALTAWGSNITDEEYLEEVIPAPEFGGSFIHPAKGEIFGLDFLYRF